MTVPRRMLRLTGIVGVFAYTAAAGMFAQVAELDPDAFRTKVAEDIRGSAWISGAKIGSMNFALPGDFDSLSALPDSEADSNRSRTTVPSAEPADASLSYLSRFIPSVLLSQIHRLPVRTLSEPEIAGVWAQAADRTAGSLLQSYADSMGQRSRAFLLGTELPELGDRRALAEAAASALSGQPAGGADASDSGAGGESSGLGAGGTGTRAQSAGLFHPAPRVGVPGQWYDEDTIPPELALEVKTSEPSVSPPRGFFLWYTDPYELISAAEREPPQEDRVRYAMFLSILDRAAADQGVQYLLFGRIVPLGFGTDYITIEYGIYSRFSRSLIAAEAFSTSWAEAGDAAFDRARDTAAAVSGQTLPRLFVQVFPPLYTVSAGGGLAGTGSVRDDYAAVGERELGFRFGEAEISSARISVDGPFEAAVFALSPPEYSFVAVESDPPGARVHLDGTAIGTTPLVAAVSGDARILEFNREGYHRRTLVLDEDSRASGVSVRLLDDRIDWSERVREQRDQFYAAFGVTILSAVLPIVLTGLHDDAVQMWEQHKTYELEMKKLDLYYALSFSYALVGATVMNTLNELGDFLVAARVAVSR